MRSILFQLAVEKKGKMWATALSDIFFLPVLLLVSIPLALSASITTALALITLFIRALVVYFELSIALLANFFLFPAHSPATGSLLALTEGTTPGIERTARTPKYSSHIGAQQTGFTKSRRGSLSSKDGVAEDYFSHHNHSQHGYAPIHSPHEALSSFISNNAERDFEGVGGWRTPLTRRKHHQTSSVPSLSRKNSSEEELLLDNNDDEVWLSINKRLELPSRRSAWKTHSLV
ncbi:conserved hypothetical protein [Talaromyces stipitatus ATCC 10500]|uniref:Uncharacterized protein n=1 Tax=Talaromyces stipitatus (strain ATCC 10500 / CBS 375.48 / QM 6759 / NRRL 1006) TaxID=441959 RepID=B8MFI2_TALSN|nr:uncharacterized protein TSTA_017900 [Talaromyces stipitatus ATCC 10500]XP_002483951.1 uncharacterized protein TSTA_017900 [Talaromyces stipitatus ATCC 10500]EED16716.1 conserved hypothetical protein [Talaromyces stipitatus ATCC 10500]EED16717.1 conserved hypothetical protein [Talaromyces stipitatus ATCC 10500]